MLPWVRNKCFLCGHCLQNASLFTLYLEHT
uniref:Uncharacterized protein n=1 Tax=Arundo donax TaxID=35708 RepID=A0A0A9BC99_ARUDO